MEQWIETHPSLHFQNLLYSNAAFVPNQFYCVEFFLSSFLSKPLISSIFISFISFYNVCCAYIRGALHVQERNLGNDQFQDQIMTFCLSTPTTKPTIYTLLPWCSSMLLNADWKIKEKYQIKMPYRNCHLWRLSCLRASLRYCLITDSLDPFQSFIRYVL